MYTGHDAESDVRVLKDGSVVNVWSVGIPNDVDADFVITPFDTACSRYDTYLNAAHAMYYAKNDSVLWGKYKVSANILVSFVLLSSSALYL